MVFLLSMSPLSYVLPVLLILGIMVLIITILIKKMMKTTSSQKPEDSPYLTFFILGITFLPMGLVLSMSTENPGFYGIAAMGLIFLIVGLSNRDKWDNDKKK